jgi:hypothetical protein
VARRKKASLRFLRGRDIAAHTISKGDFSVGDTMYAICGEILAVRTESLQKVLISVITHEWTCGCWYEALLTICKEAQDTFGSA